jgi:hypothetical protein
MFRRNDYVGKIRGTRINGEAINSPMYETQKVMERYKTAEPKSCSRSKAVDLYLRGVRFEFS